MVVLPGEKREGAQHCQILPRSQVTLRTAKMILKYDIYIVIGDLIKVSFGGLLGTKIRLQCSEQGLGSGYRKFLFLHLPPCSRPREYVQISSRSCQPGH